MSSVHRQSASDLPSFETENTNLPPQQVSNDAAAGPSHQLRDRRRERLLLSCSFCRSRKVRCDRQLPCKTCTSKGIGSTCSYMPTVSHKSKVSVGDRIQQLEALVRSLMQQQQAPPPAAHASQTPVLSLEGPFKNSPSRHSLQRTSGASLAYGDEDMVISSPSMGPVLPHSSMDCAKSPAPSDYGSMRPHSHGANYVGSVHWASVLDSISELKDHYEEEEEARLMAASDHIPRNSPGPRLLYEPIQDTKADILASIPPRPVLDRMVARYFNAQHSVSFPLLHSGHFLRQYESFWQDPSSTPILWIGLLFSIMALSMQFQRSMEDLADPETVARVYMFRERTIHCLILGEFTRGKEYVLETMLNYITVEILLFKEADIGLWLILGILVQLALGLGYHRDAHNFSNISPFAGEMRRRVWTVIVQMDLRLSIQMGLPRLLKLHQCDTAEPRNLLDTDFDESTIELPISRPETEVTPVLYILAKNRIDHMNDLVNDLLTNSREYSYAEVIELDRKLKMAEASLPPIFKWQPLSQSFMVPPQIVVHRLWLRLSKQRFNIWLHRKYLAPTYTQVQYKYSQTACIQAAIEILEFQQLVDEETQPDGLLYPVRFMTTTSVGQFVFLLGMSILSYYIQLAKTWPGISLDQDMSTKIHNLLHNSYRIWLRSSPVSREAREATEHLSLLLGLRAQAADKTVAEQPAEAITISTTTNATLSSDFTTSQDTVMPFDNVNWDAFQERTASFPSSSVFGTEFLVPPVPVPVPGSSSARGVFMADLLLTNNAGFGR